MLVRGVCAFSTADSSSIDHNLNTCIRLHQHSQFSITLLININYWSASKTAETNASRPRPRPQNFGLEWSRDQARRLEDYQTGSNAPHRLLSTQLPCCDAVTSWTSWLARSSAAWLRSFASFVQSAVQPVVDIVLTFYVPADSKMDHFGDVLGSQCLGSVLSQQFVRQRLSSADDKVSGIERPLAVPR